MTNHSNRPWERKSSRVSRLGIALIIASVCIFGFGIVQQGLVATSKDKTSVQYRERADELDRQAKNTTDPYERERLREAANEMDFEADRQLTKHWDHVNYHVYFIILGILLALAGVIVLIVHRRRVRNIM